MKTTHALTERKYNAPPCAVTPVTIEGQLFFLYKHWSYDGYCGIYLPDQVSKVGEMINTNPVFNAKLSEAEKEWIKTYYPNHFKIINH